MFLTRLCRSGTVAPRYIYVVAETPILLRRGPIPCMRDMPMTTAVVLCDGGCWGGVRTAAGGACCWCWLPTKLACPWAAEAAASTWWRPVASCTTGMGRPTCPVVCTGWEGCRLWGTGGATGWRRSGTCRGTCVLLPLEEDPRLWSADGVCVCNYIAVYSCICKEEYVDYVMDVTKKYCTGPQREYRHVITF